MSGSGSGSGGQNIGNGDLNGDDGPTKLQSAALMMKQHGHNNKEEKSQQQQKINNTSNGIAETPQPPYYAVIFTSNRKRSNKQQQSEDDQDQDYSDTAQRMLDLAKQEKGFLGVESVREDGLLGITVSYWSSLEAIKHWKNHTEHLVAQEKGYKQWYSSYKTRICLVERDYGF